MDNEGYNTKGSIKSSTIEDRLKKRFVEVGIQEKVH